MKISTARIRKKYFALNIFGVDINIRNILKIVKRYNISDTLIAFEVKSIKDIQDILIKQKHFVEEDNKTKNYKIKLIIKDLKDMSKVIERIIELNLDLIEIYGNCDIKENTSEFLFLNYECKMALILIPNEYELIIWAKKDTYKRKNTINDLYSVLE